jgi:hypothetical protein
MADSHDEFFVWRHVKEIVYKTKQLIELPFRNLNCDLYVRKFVNQCPKCFNSALVLMDISLSIRINMFQNFDLRASVWYLA